MDEPPIQTPASVVTSRVDADGVGWVVFDDPASKANVFTPGVLQALGDALARVVASQAKALVIVSEKKRIFIAGADLRWLSRLDTPEEAAAVARLGQRAFEQVASLGIPVVCAIQGACAGGGCELALAADRRLAADTPETVIGLPETGLGIIPGWGGCVRLQRLVGAAAALEHILAAQLLPAAKALEKGLVDEVVPAASLRDRAKAVALSLVAAKPARGPVPRAEPAELAKIEQQAKARAGGNGSAFAAASRVVARAQDVGVADALEAEAVAFGAEASGPGAKNLLHVYFLKEAARKRTLEAWFTPAGAVPRIAKVGVVGAGVMGSGIAQHLAAKGFSVVLVDADPEALKRGLKTAGDLFGQAVVRGKTSAAEAAEGLARIQSAAELGAFADCDAVIEAIVENLEAKQALFARLSAVVRPDAILASNTSALPIEAVARDATHPERTLGIHFFNPVSRMALVELVLSPKTGAAAAEASLALLKALGKSPVICRSSPGFLVTRVLFFYLNAAVGLFERGVAAGEIDAALKAYGWPMGPLRLIDEVGVDVTEFIFGEMEQYFPGRFLRTGTCAKLLAQGLRGRKNGASSGFYSYAAKTETLNPAALALAPAGGSATSAEAIREHLMTILTREARRCLEEGVIRTPEDVDFALLSGAGFPAFRGGLLWQDGRHP